jgi:hypothetical protein
MKALTIWQPWPLLIVEGFKPYEFRGWPAPRSIVGQRIVIHAAKRKARAAELVEIMNYVVSERARRIDRIDPRAHDLVERLWRLGDSAIPYSVGLGTATVGTPFRFLDGRWGWPMLDVEKWAKPVPAKGAQGFWNWPA